jgi:hypothetical protein
MFPSVTVRITRFLLKCTGTSDIRQMYKPIADTEGSGKKRFAGIALGAAFARWSGFPNWVLVVGGLVVMIRGLRSLRTGKAPISRSQARHERRESRRKNRQHPETR